MISFIILLFWTYKDKIFKGRVKIKDVQSVWNETTIAFLFSIIIEFSQLMFKLGTFQLSDIVFNTLGGFIGGIIYYFIDMAYRKGHDKRT